MDIHPYVALMRRYCIDYTTVHDASVCDDIMADDYTVTVSGRVLQMPDYRAAVQGAFAWFPTLTLTVHELVMSGDRLAMRFSEHGGSAKHDGAVAVWQGISLYRWDGQRLLACDVEQDFVGRERQFAAGRPDVLDDAAIDPWSTTRDRPPDPAAEQVVRDWLQAWADRDDRRDLEGHDFRLVVDDSHLVGPDDLVLDDVELEVADLFSAGDAVAARIVLRGTYGGGLPGVGPEARGRRCDLPAVVLAHADGDGGLVDLRMVRDRWGLQRRLR